jgi:hypothetical protein
VAVPAKAEWPPLYGPGFHEMTLADLRLRCVDAFSISKRRDPVMLSLEAMCLAISVVQLQAEVWIDGSFTTSKIEPDDVDVVVLYNDLFGGGTREQQEIIRRIKDQDFQFPLKCDSYVSRQYAPDHLLHSFSLRNRDYWIRQFGFSRGNNQKGIVLIRTPVS